jgi:hypothetical protein
MLLIHPPLVKPCEPPPGLAKLAGVMNYHNIPCRVIDANVEGIMSLLAQSKGMSNLPADFKENQRGESVKTLVDTWTRRAFRDLEINISALTSPKAYINIDRYRRAVMDINRVLEVSAFYRGVRLNLSNYLNQNLSPVRSADLINASEKPESDPFYPYFRERLAAVLAQEEPDVIGFSLNYLSQALCTFAMIGFLRQTCPGIRIVLGGGLVTSWVRQPGWSNPFKGLVDDLIGGPGESYLLSMYGMTHQEGHTTPDYTLFPMKGYLSPGPILPYSASSGCYWGQCAFCPERAEGNPYRPVSADRVISDLHTLSERTKPVLIHLLDNALSPLLLKRIAGASFGVPWYGFARISSHLTDMDFCLALKRSGCVMLQLGVESGDQKVLDSMHKGFDLEMSSAVLKTLKKAGIATYVYLLFGTPSETILEARKTMNFTITHNDHIDFLNCAIFNLPAHGPEVKELETCDFYEGDLSLYRSFLHPGGWNRNAVRQFLNKEFKRHPAVAAILRRSPPLFTSNHAPFFVTHSEGECVVK